VGSATSVLLCYPCENAQSKFLVMFISYVGCISLLRVWKAVAEHRSAAAQMPRVLHKVSVAECTRLSVVPKLIILTILII
jgi:hypothetical protein